MAFIVVVDSHFGDLDCCHLNINYLGTLRIFIFCPLIFCRNFPFVFHFKCLHCHCVHYMWTISFKVKAPDRIKPYGLSFIHIKGDYIIFDPNVEQLYSVVLNCL